MKFDIDLTSKWNFCVATYIYCTMDTSSTVSIIAINVHVVVYFYPWFEFYFLLFLGIVMYDNEFETKENKIWTKGKIEPQQRHYEIARCNIIQIIMRLEENHKFLVIETPRSVLFFNRVISSFACPKQNKKVSPRYRRIRWIQLSSYSYALSCS